jgi:hypothetical protein
MLHQVIWVEVEVCSGELVRQDTWVSLGLLHLGEEGAVVEALEDGAVRWRLLMGEYNEFSTSVGHIEDSFVLDECL